MIGIVFTGVCVLFGAYITSIVGGGYINHPLEPAPWLFAVGVLPVVCAALYFANTPQKQTRLSRIAETAIVAFAILVMVGAIMAPLVEVLHRGYRSTNISGYMVWSAVYALVLLPLAWPLAVLLSRITRKTPNKTNRR